MDTPSITHKHCSRKEKCINPLGSWLPLECFRKHKGKPHGLALQCKACADENRRGWAARNADHVKKYHAQRYANDRQRFLDKEKRYRVQNAAKISERGKRYRSKNKEVIREKNKAKYWNNREKDLERSRQYRLDNREEIAAKRRRQYHAAPEKYREQKRKSHMRNRERHLVRNKERYRANPEPYLEQSRTYRRENRQKATEINKRWRHNNPERSRQIKRRYLDKKCNVLNDLSAQDWKLALDYFRGCCAACGRAPGLWHTLVKDHWIPVSKGGATTATNIIPLCHSMQNGSDGCNNVKHNLDAKDFLERRFGRRKTREILARIQAYFDILK